MTRLSYGIAVMVCVSNFRFKVHLYYHPHDFQFDGKPPFTPCSPNVVV